MLGINGGSMKQNHVECHLLKLFHGGYLEETPFSVYVLGIVVKVWFHWGKGTKEELLLHVC